jgi:hypothetical protein
MPQIPDAILGDEAQIQAFLHQHAAQLQPQLQQRQVRSARASTSCFMFFDVVLSTSHQCRRRLFE